MRLRLLALALALFIVVLIAAYIASTTQGYLEVSDLRNARRGSVNVIGVIESYRVEGETLKVTLAGRGESKVILEIPLDLFTAVHGRPPGPWIIGKSVGVRGYYEPGVGDPSYLGVVKVKEILNPCHDSYKAPPART